MLGDTPNGFHGYVRIQLDIVGWRYIEPQEGGLIAIIDIFASVSASEYRPEYEFNDVYAYQVT